MPDFRIKQEFPIASVIDAAGRNAQLQEQAREAGNKSIIEGLQGIGQIGESLFETRKRVAQSLALGRQFDVPDELSRTMEPAQVLEAAKIKQHMTDTGFAMNAFRAQLGLPPLSGGATKTPSGATPVSENNPSPAGGAMLASDTTTTPLPEANGSMPPAAGSVPVPIPAPPAFPTQLTPGQMKLLQHMVDANRMDPVVSEDDALKAGGVRHGAKLIHPSRDTAGNVLFIGNATNGDPLLLNKKGAITRGKVPVERPQTPGGPQTGGPVLPKTSTMPTASTRASSEFAETLIPHIQSMRGLIQQAEDKGYIGPAAGRVYGQFLAGKVGSTGDPKADRLLGQLRATDSLLKTGAMRVHFGARGGQQMYDHFSDLLNSGKQSAAMLNGALDGIETFMEGYAEAGHPGKTQSGGANAQAGPDIHDMALEWAQANPNDPRSAAILQKAMEAKQKGPNLGI